MREMFPILAARVKEKGETGKSGFNVLLNLIYLKRYRFYKIKLLGYFISLVLLKDFEILCQDGSGWTGSPRGWQSFGALAFVWPGGRGHLGPFHRR